MLEETLEQSKALMVKALMCLEVVRSARDGFNLLAAVNSRAGETSLLTSKGGRRVVKRRPPQPSLPQRPT